MFRFLHAADLHLDSPLRGLEQKPDAPADTLRGATRRALENLVDLAIGREVDFVLIAGDVFDGDWKDYSTGLFFRGQLARLDRAGIQVHLIAGNHDAASVVTRHLQPPKNVHTHSTRKADSVELDGLPVAIHGRGFPNRAVVENLALDYPVAVPGRFNIGLLHTSLTGRSGHDNYAPCSIDDLRSRGYDYWALGHIHQPEVVGENPWIVFPGNLQGRHARETGPRGCCLVEVDDALQVGGVEWHHLDVVRWDRVEVALDGVDRDAAVDDAVAAALAAAVARADGRLLAARVVFTGATPLHGALHRRERQHWRSRCLAAAQDLGDDRVWIEKVEAATSPVHDLAELAARDPLMELVLRSLDQWRPAPATDSSDDADAGDEALPASVPHAGADVLRALPPDLQRELAADWHGERLETTINEVRAMVLDALANRQSGDAAGSEPLAADRQGGAA